MRPLFVDSSPLLLALGKDHPQRASCRQLLDAAHEGRFGFHVSAETIQEVLFHRMRVAGREQGVQDAKDIKALCVVHPLDEPVLQRGIDLASTTALRGRDAMHAATAMLAGFDTLVSTDPDFVDVPRLRLLHPREAIS